MNLIEGVVENGVFSGGGLRIAGLGRANIARAVMGVRPEDVHVVSAKDETVNLVAPIYSAELTARARSSVSMPTATCSQCALTRILPGLRSDDRRQGIAGPCISFRSAKPKSCRYLRHFSDWLYLL